MAFSGTDIYVLGEINDSIGYWKNGQFNFLALADSVLPVSIAIVGTDVFSFLQQQTDSWPGELYQNTVFYSELPTSNQPGLTTIYETAQIFIFPDPIQEYIPTPCTG